MNEYLDPKEAVVDIYCKELKLPGLKDSFRDIARDAMIQNLSRLCMPPPSAAHFAHHSSTLILFAVE